MVSNVRAIDKPSTDQTTRTGGSSTGARRVCAPYTDPTHVDIGDMSRQGWIWIIRLQMIHRLTCSENFRTCKKTRGTQSKM